MIRFGNKYFTLIAVLFVIYIGYVNTKDARRPTPAHDRYLEETRKGPGRAKYRIEVDPSKPEKDRGFAEKILLKMYGDKIPQKPQAAQAPPISKPLPKKLVFPIQEGDTVTFIYRDITDTSVSEPDPVTIIAGKSKLPAYIEKALIGMKRGDFKLINKEGSEADGGTIQIEVIDVYRYQAGK